MPKRTSDQCPACGWRKSYDIGRMAALTGESAHARVCTRCGRMFQTQAG